MLKNIKFMYYSVLLKTLIFLSIPRHRSDKLFINYDNDYQRRICQNCVNFMIPGAGIHVLGHGHTSHLMKMHYLKKNIFLYSFA